MSRPSRNEDSSASEVRPNGANSCVFYLCNCLQRHPKEMGSCQGMYALWLWELVQFLGGTDDLTCKELQANGPCPRSVLFWITNESSMICLTSWQVSSYEKRSVWGDQKTGWVLNEYATLMCLRNVSLFVWMLFYCLQIIKNNQQQHHEILKHFAELLF